MGMSSAHIFYIPIIFFVGVFAGFFLGRRAAENEARELKKRRARRQAIREHAGGGEEATKRKSESAN